jgi:hypothetical protein
VTTPSKLGPAFLCAFGLPFVGMGLFAAFTFLHAANQPLPSRIGEAVFASAFTIIGGGLIFGSLYGYSRMKKQSEIELAHPGSPWLWRLDWAARRVESKNKASAIGWWVVAVLVNMISLPASMGGISQGLNTHDPKFVFPVAFELIGLIVLFGAIRATIRFERFGKTYFEMTSLPFSPGSRLAGAIHVQLDTDAALGVDLKLGCIRRVMTGSGDHRSTQQVPLWEDTKNVPATSLIRGPLDTVIPVEFGLPADAFQTDHDNPNDQVVWMLKAKADVPGVDYSDEFELPVFRTSSSPSAAAISTGGTQIRSFAQTTTTSGEVSVEVSEPLHHRVIIDDSPEGLQFNFRAGRNVARTVLVVSLAVAVSALLYAMLRIKPQPPKFIFAMVGVLDFILVLVAIRAALSTTRITVGNGVISWRRSIFGMGKSHELQISDVESILAFTSVQQASSSGDALYSLRLKSKSGKNYTLVDDIESRQEARWIISKIDQRAGLRLNTQVEISNSFYGPPPQPGSASTSDSVFSAGGLRATGRTSNNLSQAVGAIFFVGWLGFIGYMMLRRPHFSSARSIGSTASTSTRAGSVTRGAPPFVRTTAIKQALLEDVLALPPQQQAEELMARAVEHDSAALQAIAQRTPAWVGHTQLSGNLKQLEEQGRYSSDLRVRRVEADLELTLDGWSKTPNSVDLLTGHAKSDPASRPRALYFLGILAGDGIAAESAYQFVLDSARNNADPTTRQWATEGLRFVGTDAALDALFEIFTQDSSFAVRDRAGCNISDCGIFERKQRLRLVPRLIDVVSDPHANAQMRNWSFMALREITDENLPSDAVAWRRWYNDKASTKRAQFELLDWWRVRGDN